MKYRIREKNELKSSGVEWLGDIPKDWEYHKNKYIFKRISNNVGDNYDNYKVLSLTLNGVIERNMNNMGKMPSSFSIYQIVEKESLILCLFDIDVTPRIIGYVNTQGIISSAYTNLIVKNLYSKYYYYWFLTLNNQNILLNYTKSLRNTINNENFMSLESLVCSFFEQQKIADFLDEKSKIFDEAISKKEQLISKLELAKQSLISEVVTGKLKVVEQNSKLQTIKREKNELKPSGIEWLGDIPKDWQVKKLKYISEIISSNVDKKSYEEQEKVLLCNYVDVYKNDFITNKINFMEATASESEIKKFSLQLGDILITKDSESPNDIAIPAYVNEEFENVLCGYHLAILRNNKNEVYSKYLYRFFQLIGVRNYFETMAKGVTRYGLSLDAFKNIFVPNFYLEEQQKISKYLDEKLIHFDNTIEKTKQSITKLKEAKEALISQAVTGKIEVL